LYKRRRSKTGIPYVVTGVFPQQLRVDQTDVPADIAKAMASGLAPPDVDLWRAEEPRGPKVLVRSRLRLRFTSENWHRIESDGASADQRPAGAMHHTTYA
jgi:hypothetical protein